MLGEILGVGDPSVDRDALGGVGAPGDVGEISDPSRYTSLSNTASGSEGRWLHRSTAASQSSPPGALGRPSQVLERGLVGAIIPARAPPSIDMLQTVIRSSMVSRSIASPRYSMTWP
jgi:hypothetical protein